VDVSADGQVFAAYEVQRRVDCSAVIASNCHDVYTYTGTVIGPSIQLTSSSQPQLSRNGRFALFGSTTVVDFGTGASRALSLKNATVSSRQALADDGTVLIPNGGQYPGFLLSGPAKAVELDTNESVASARIDSTAAHIAYTTPSLALRSFDVATRRDKLLAAYSVSWYSLAGDGRVVAYIAGFPATKAPQVFSRDSTEGASRQLTSDDKYPHGFTEAEISPDGKTIYAVSPASLIVRIDVASGAVKEIVPRTPYIGNRPDSLVPGSMVKITGSGLSGSTVAATGQTLPLSLGGAKVIIANLEAPILYASPTMILFQAPFETPFGDVRITLPSKSPFLGSASTDTVVTGWDASFLQLFIPGLNDAFYAIHQDFQSLVTLDRPAMPGEILHFYATGLGPTDTIVATAQAAPSSPLARVIDSLDCIIRDDSGGTPVTVAYAGLAPGRFGIYQIDIVLPAAFHKAPGQRYLLLACGLMKYSGGFSRFVASFAIPE
jgi:uncharacterized protein (TIGR03437 family)